MLTDNTQQLIVRHLSITEVVLRSRIGGDCISDSEFELGLDPNVHAYTLTDSNNFSKGHITIVLGTASNKKVAFVDYIQNISNREIPFMLEAIRRSVEQKGYILALSQNIAAKSLKGGIFSNNEDTIRFVTENIKRDKTVLTNFTPNSHNYNFEPHYSRAYQKLPINPITPIENIKNIEFVSKQTFKPWKLDELNIKDLVNSSKKLKNGTIEDKINYIPSMRLIIEGELGTDAKFNETLSNWMTDTNENFKLRKHVLYYYFENQNKLAILLNHFTDIQQLTIIHEILETTRYKNIILKRENEFVELLTKIRKKTGIRQQALRVFDERYISIMDDVLKASDINNQEAFGIIKTLEKSFASTNFTFFLEAFELSRHTSLDKQIENVLIYNYLKNNRNGNAKIGIEILKVLQGNNKIHKKLVTSLLLSRKDILNKYFKTSKIFEILTKLNISHKYGLDNDTAIKMILKDPKENISLKSELMIIHFGTKKFLKYLNYIPKKQLNDFWKETNKTTNIQLFIDLASERKLSYDIFIGEKVEAYQFKKMDIPDEGKTYVFWEIQEKNPERRTVFIKKQFAVQASEVTQLQWYLVNGTNPSQAKGKNITVINNVEIGKNSPINWITLFEIEKHIAAINKKNKKYENDFSYKLPNGDQWEYAARAGSRTKYYFGNKDRFLKEHAWFDENSNETIHEIAQLKPNGFGLYDMSGNTWERVTDLFKDKSSIEFDPFTENIFEETMPYLYDLRGGSFRHSANSSRSSFADYAPPDIYSKDISFRMIIE